jgi:hypothetical protein
VILGRSGAMPRRSATTCTIASLVARIGVSSYKPESSALTRSGDNEWECWSLHGGGIIRSSLVLWYRPGS